MGRLMMTASAFTFTFALTRKNNSWHEGLCDVREELEAATMRHAGSSDAVLCVRQSLALGGDDGNS
eukprot:749646-Hanusia_phi.AAC.3